MHPSTIINLEPSNLRNRLYIVYTAGGDSVYIGNPYQPFFTESLGGTKGTKQTRRAYYESLGESQLDYCRSLKAGRTLYETFILNGPSKNKIANINYFNQLILNQKHLGV
jgi:hypothetical protein